MYRVSVFYQNKKIITKTHQTISEYFKRGISLKQFYFLKRKSLKNSNCISDFLDFFI